jgi:hypothetical protein
MCLFKKKNSCRESTQVGLHACYCKMTIFLLNPVLLLKNHVDSIKNLVRS